jgi:intracellular multiplication protein IcmP
LPAGAKAVSQKSVIDDQPVIAFMVLICCFLLLGWIIWLLFEPQILSSVRYIRLGELYLINLVTLGEYDTLIKLVKPAWLGGPPEPYVSSFTRAKFLITTSVIGSVLRWPVGIGLFAVGVYAMFFTQRGKFNNQYNLEELIKVQARIWPIITPIVGFNPARSNARANGDPVPAELPLFAEALSPEEWLAYHAIPIHNGLPDRETVLRALTQQLGPRWNGVDKLPPYLKALFAAFALKGAQRRVESDDLLGEIALCWSHKTGFALSLPLAKKIDDLIADPEVGGKAAVVAQQHAYRTTALLAVLRWGRAMGGVLAPAAFLWLRGEDRALWYPLNNLGRRSYHSEAAGAMAHFMAEQAAKKPLPLPRVETALITINQYLANSHPAIPPRLSAASTPKGTA